MTRSALCQEKTASRNLFTVIDCGLEKRIEAVEIYLLIFVSTSYSRFLALVKTKKKRFSFLHPLNYGGRRRYLE